MFSIERLGCGTRQRGREAERLGVVCLCCLVCCVFPTPQHRRRLWPIVVACCVQSTDVYVRIYRHDLYACAIRSHKAQVDMLLDVMHEIIGECTPQRIERTHASIIISHI